MGHLRLYAYTVSRIHPLGGGKVVARIGAGMVWVGSDLLQLNLLVCVCAVFCEGDMTVETKPRIRLY